MGYPSALLELLEFSHVQPLSCAFPDVLQIPSLGLLWVVGASCSLQRHLGQQSKPWHSSAFFSPTTPALALPAQVAQSSRSLRPVVLSLYVHCLASRHCYPETLACRGLDFSSLFPAPTQHPFLHLSVLVCSAHALLPPHASPRSPRRCQLWDWCCPAVPLAGSPEHG